MSWEEMSVDKHPCPCGKGTYSVTHRMDDWNRTNSSMHMDCEECQSKYVLFSENQNRGGLPHTARFWICKEAEVEYWHLREAAATARRQVKKLRTQRYLPQWMALFVGKNKKQAWEILTNDGTRYPALGTFYQHTKVEGLEAYLERHFSNADDRTWLEIETTLGVDDREISDLVRLVDEYESNAHDLAWREKFPK